MDIAKEITALDNLGILDSWNSNTISVCHFALTHNREQVLDRIYARLAVDIEFALNYPKDMPEGAAERLEALQAAFETLRGQEERETLRREEAAYYAGQCDGINTGRRITP